MGRAPPDLIFFMLIRTSRRAPPARTAGLAKALSFFSMEPPSAASAGDGEWAARRRAVLRDAIAVGVSTGAYGLSFGAVSSAAGLSLAQTAALSLLMFTGASQFALVGVLAGGGGALAAAATATLLGARNAFYGLRLTSLLGVTGPKRLLAAHLVIDESTAMAVMRDDERAGRLAFWATGTSVFVLWNLATLAGAAGARALADPAVLGLDAAAPAAFLALLAPRLRDRSTWLPSAAAAGLALLLTPVLPTGVPILAAALLVVLIGARPARRGDRP
jgi:predicted branched-subunit amino acid permease